MIVILIAIAVISIISLLVIVEYHESEKHDFVVIGRYKTPYYKKNYSGGGVYCYIHEDSYVKYLLLERCKRCGKVVGTICKDYDVAKALRYKG